MSPVAILYATREGQTRKIAEHVASALRERGHTADVLDVREPLAAFSLNTYRAAIVAASVHAGNHEREMVSFVRAHRTALEGMPSAFLSVSLDEASAERAPSAEQRAKGESGVRRSLDMFFAATGWNPSRVLPVAGALLYRQYGFVKRWMMRRISKASGGDTDTSKNFEYTDWHALDRFVVELVCQLPA